MKRPCRARRAATRGPDGSASDGAGGAPPSLARCVAKNAVGATAESAGIRRGRRTVDAVGVGDGLGDVELVHPRPRHGLDSLLERLLLLVRLGGRPPVGGLVAGHGMHQQHHIRHVLMLLVVQRRQVVAACRPQPERGALEAVRARAALREQGPAILRCGRPPHLSAWAWSSGQGVAMRRSYMRVSGLDSTTSWPRTCTRRWPR